MTPAVQTRLLLSADPASRGTRLPALGAVGGPVLFTLAWLVLGFVSDGYTLFGYTFADYSVVSQSISGLGLGSTGPAMNTAFIVAGLMLIVGVLAARRLIGPPAPGRAATILLACTGLGQIVCGVFTLQAMMLHTSGFLLALGMPVISFVVAGRQLLRVPGWRTFGTGLAAIGSPVAAVLLIAYFIAFQPTIDGAEHGIAGLVQRIGAVHALGWFVALGWRAYRRAPVA